MIQAEGRPCLRRLALLWVAAHALSLADRSYLLSRVLAAIARLAAAEVADLEPTDATATRTGPMQTVTLALPLRGAQHAVLSALTAAAEQLLSCGGGQPVLWALQSIQRLFQVSMCRRRRGCNLHQTQL